jgi:hypothetical protein
MPPLALTSRTSKRSGSSSGGSWVGIFLGEGSSQAAGVRRSSASCGRVWLHSSRKWLNFRGWARRSAPGGRVVSAFRVRGIRAWRPFWCGLPGSMHSGRRPRRTHHADHWESRARVLVAHGTPWSVRRRGGRPKAWNTRVNTGLASSTLVEERAGHASSKRRSPSLMVNGEP